MIITKDSPQEIGDLTPPNIDAPPPSYSRAEASSSTGASTSNIKTDSGALSLSPPPDLNRTTSARSLNTYYAPNTFRGQASEDLEFYAPFSRVPPEELPYSSFPPMFIVAKGKSLDKGFHAAPPPSTTRPHPFFTHDVTEEDWLRFLKDIQNSAALTEKDIGRSHIPILSLIPFARPMAKFGIQKFMKSQKKHKVVKVIDTWNHHFFGLRKLRVIFMRGRTKLSGTSDAPVSTAAASPDSPLDDKAESSTEASAVTGPEANWDDDLFRLLVVFTS